MSQPALSIVLAARAALSALVASVAPASPKYQVPPSGAQQSVISPGAPRTPITHVVENFQENVSFDHDFATYPKATNSDGRRFKAAPGTPAVDGLPPATSSSLPPSLRHSTNLLVDNPNAARPKRLDASPTGLPGSAGGQLTCDPDHNYSDDVISKIGEGLEQSFLMAYEVWWALVLGFAISAIVQAWVPRERIESALSGSGPGPVAKATGLGAASSSCSYAAIAIGKSLFQKGASATTTLAF